MTNFWGTKRKRILHFTRFELSAKSFGTPGGTLKRIPYYSLLVDIVCFKCFLNYLNMVALTNKTSKI